MKAPFPPLPSHLTSPKVTGGYSSIQGLGAGYVRFADDLLGILRGRLGAPAKPANELLAELPLQAQEPFFNLKKLKKLYKKLYKNTKNKKYKTKNFF